MKTLLENIDTIIFDFGGVLYRINPEDSFSAFTKLINKSGVKVSREVILSRLVVPYEKGELSSPGFINGLRSYCNNVIDNNELIRIWNLTLKELYPDSFQILSYFKKYYDILLLSNTNEIHYEFFKPECREIFSLFRKKYFSYQIGMAKPDNEIFNYLIEDAGINKSKSLFIDDNTANIATAKAMGFRTLLLDNRNKLSELFHTVKKYTQNNEI